MFPIVLQRLCVKKSSLLKIMTPRGISSVSLYLQDITKNNNSPSLESKTEAFCYSYYHLSLNEKKEILKILSREYDFDKNSVKKAAELYITQDRNIGAQLNAAERLKSCLIPGYAYLFLRIKRLEGGIKFLVDLRADLLNILQERNFTDESSDYLKSLNNYLKEILSIAFNVGFLNLERITWDSSCHMLEKISEYEAVHPVRNWTDIKQRVGPYRRCYVFTHNSMPKEPIVVLHTALTEDIANSIQSIVKRIKNDPSKTTAEEKETPEKINAAIFYSISSTQKGLHGIELGNQLIKKVVREILMEFPHINKLSSLSPIPGFKEWFLFEIRKAKNGNSILPSFFGAKELAFLRGNFKSNDAWSSLSKTVASNEWIKNEGLKEFFKTPFLKICAHYLYYEKRRSNALNSVAHFHLRNGAVLWRINWLADTSPRGLENSCGLMVNYRYYIERTEDNSKAYIENHQVCISDDVKDLLLPAIKSSL